MSKGALFRGPPAAGGLLAASLLACAIATGPSAHAQDSRSLQDMLLAAIRLNDAAAVRSAVAAGVDVSKRTYNGKTALDVAVDLGRFDIAELLVAERRRQREAPLAVPAAVARAPAQTVDIVQPSAEAPPELAPVSPPPPASAPVSLTPPMASAPAAPAAAEAAAVTPEQLLAMAQQLAAAAQALAGAPARSAAPKPAAAAVPPPAPKPVAAVAPPPPINVEMVRVIHPFAPTPGRKPELARRPTGAEPVVASVPDSVVVTPKRYTFEQGADRVREELEGAPERTAPVQPTGPPPSAAASAPRAPAHGAPPAPQGAPAVQPTAHAAPEPDAEQAEPEDSKIMKAIKGIGGFFFTEPGSRSEAPAAGAKDLRDHLREPPRRKNVPHVPAKRASEYRTEVPPPAQSQPPSSQPPSGQPGMAQPARAAAPRAPNPFDPGTSPLGALLPLTDPLAGDTPEIAPARLPEPTAEPTVDRAPPVAPVQRETRRSEPRAKAEPVARAPAVPPLADAAAAQSPTAVFERHAVSRAAPPPPKEEGFLKSLATAVGLSGEDADEPSAEPGDPEKLLSRKMPVLNLRPPLTDVPLTLGVSVVTGEQQLPRGIAEPDPCIRRSGGAVVFCVVPVDWPQGIDQAFSLTTYLYQGTRAIARYDAGRATHYHALFASRQFKDVVSYLTNRYGPPTDEWKRSISPFDRPRQPNPTLVWRSRDSRTNQVTILEVRQFDDTRNVFPDMDHGAVRLYKSGAQRVFPVITGIDIMGIEWAARSDHTDGVDGRALANTIRIGR